MGEAKRKREAVLNGPCPCGSTRPGRSCCFNGKDWSSDPLSLSTRIMASLCFERELDSGYAHEAACQMDRGVFVHCGAVL